MQRSANGTIRIDYYYYLIYLNVQIGKERITFRPTYNHERTTKYEHHYEIGGFASE